MATLRDRERKLTEMALRADVSLDLTEVWDITDRLVLLAEALGLDPVLAVDPSLPLGVE